ncbi:MAG: hypothetical protein AB7V16_12270 [Vulcanibacillus sp.]
MKKLIIFIIVISIILDLYAENSLRKEYESGFRSGYEKAKNENLEIQKEIIKENISIFIKNQIIAGIATLYMIQLYQAGLFLIIAAGESLLFASFGVAAIVSQIFLTFTAGVIFNLIFGYTPNYGAMVYIIPQGFSLVKNTLQQLILNDKVHKNKISESKLMKEFENSIEYNEKSETYKNGFRSGVIKYYEELSRKDL